ncbi:phosphatase [Aeromonas schubertii]|uniref:Phosphatase n=1 Tax=Aeromonas schubertii TaxID=652 RepID=A0ABS7VEN3_9GAMM|nr:phosphatase [Aeromonas schubertii]MBZ6067842.1 phosphatase [Aeromonas schubertii]
MKYLVDTHTHTIASTHAYSTIHDYLPVAKAKGIALFATTDHGPEMADAPHYWHFVNLRVLPRVIDGVGILRGIEANIKNEAGDIDFPDHYLPVLDLVMAGFHEPVFPPRDQDSHTHAMINAIRSGRVDIISHPGNPAFPIDIDAVVRAAAEHRVALEINNSSFEHSRKGSESNCRAIVEAARDHGAWLAFGSDSHVAFTLGDFDHCRRLVEEAEFPRDRLLARTPETLLGFLEQRGHPRITEFDTLRALYG